MRISDWSSDVCSSDLPLHPGPLLLRSAVRQTRRRGRHRNNPATVWSAPLRGPAAPGKPFIILSELLSKQPLFKAMDCISCPIGSTSTRGNCEIGRAHVWTPVTNAHLVCRLLPEKKKSTTDIDKRNNEHSINTTARTT